MNFVHGIRKDELRVLQSVTYPPTETSNDRATVRTFKFKDAKNGKEQIQKSWRNQIKDFGAIKNDGKFEAFKVRLGC